MIKPITLSELMNTEYEETQWLVDGLIPALGITILSGQPGSFKTWLLQEIANKVSQGELLFEKFKTQQGNVLIIDEENNHGLLKSRFVSLGVNEKSIIFLNIKGGFRADVEADMNRIVEFIKANKIGLVCIDSMVRIHNKEENVANQMAEVFNALNKITNAGATIIMTHHHNKGASRNESSLNDLRGSSDISAAIDCQISIKADKNNNVITLEQNKLRNAQEAKPFDLNIIIEEEKISFVYEGTSAEQNREDQIKEKIIIALKEGQKNRKEIDAILNSEYGHNAIGEALGFLVEAERIIIDKKGKGGKKIYSINNLEKNADEIVENEEVEVVETHLLQAPF